MSASTGWETSPQQEVGPQPPELVGKLNTERVELSQKIERLKTFMTLDARFQGLSWHHRRLLEQQLENMCKYEGNLVERMILLNQKENEDE